MNFIPGEDKTYYGLTRNYGIATPSKNGIELEFHAGQSYTSTINKTKVNVFDVANEFFDFIMEE